jgi:hypothetical protein
MTLTLPRISATLAIVSAPVLLLALAPGCGGNKENDYKPKPAYSGKAVDLPAVPTLPKKPKKQGDAYTVSGAIHDLRSRVHAEALLKQEQISVVGYIIKTNLADAPPCAVHKTGKADGKECEKLQVPIPTFWIADEKGAPEKEAIPVMGWASNFAKIFDAVEKYKKPNNKEAAKDDTWGVAIPNPIPAKDAKVKVTGKYSTTFTLASQGVESNPLAGIVTYKSMEYLEPPPTPGILPGMKPLAGGLRAVGGEIDSTEGRGGRDVRARPRAHAHDLEGSRRGRAGWIERKLHVRGAVGVEGGVRIAESGREEDDLHSLEILRGRAGPRRRAIGPGACRQVLLVRPRLAAGEERRADGDRRAGEQQRRPDDVGVRARARAILLLVADPLVGQLGRLHEDQVRPADRHRRAGDRSDGSRRRIRGERGDVPITNGAGALQRARVRPPNLDVDPIGIDAPVRRQRARSLGPHEPRRRLSHRNLHPRRDRAGARRQ